MNINSLSGSEILSITHPGFLFDKNKFHEEYKLLAKKWHPDLCKYPDANIVFAHINDLYDKLSKTDTDHIFVSRDYIQFQSADNKQYKMKITAHHKFDLGDMYINDTAILFLFEKKYQKFYENFRKSVSNLKYPRPDLEAEFKKYFPEVILNTELFIDKYAIIIKKTKDLILMKDVISYFKDGYVDPKHVAWILSSIYNIQCYFEHMGISHNSITTDMCYISPEFHSVAILGGWWNSVNIGSKMIGVTSEILNIMTPTIREKKVGNTRTDLESIKLIGRNLFGDKIGNKLKSDKNIPKPMSDWLISPSSGSAVNDYKIWTNVLQESFGKRKFIELNLTSKIVYDKIKLT